MEIRELAETILFSTTLEGKLLAPASVTDVTPGAPIATPTLPARPAGLSLSNENVQRVPFPKIGELDLDAKRGQVLHFFANHELLALELMALALLKFPEAPPRFRRILVATMADEQRHMNLYMERMGALGVELGEIPMSGLFWRLISNMEVPLDFVARMSLTFEQANLDFSLHYRDAFTQVGDDVSASIMQEVLVDEVAHVGHGLAFFEEWRNSEESLWESFEAALPFPMSPARAKGIGFTVEHRLNAGLPQGFIDRLRVYSHSKGRSPRVFLFNPGTERALGQGRKEHQPREALVEMSQDLEILPMFLSSREDVVLVRKEPEASHLNQLMTRGFDPPEFVVANLDEGGLGRKVPLVGRKIESIQPWGWDPSVASLLAPLSKGWRDENLHRLVERRRDLSSKAWIAAQLPRLLAALPEGVGRHVVRENLPVVAHSVEEVVNCSGVLKRSGYLTAVVKAPFGTAGRDALRINTDGLRKDEVRWMERTIKNQTALVVEPWYERLLDLSYQFKVDPKGGMKELGLTHFFTTDAGQYRGTLLGQLHVGLSPEVHDFIYRSGLDGQWLLELGRHVSSALMPAMTEREFEGRGGIDMMVVRDVDGITKLRAPLELNPRATMGHVGLSIGRVLANGSVGLFLLINRKELAGTDADDFPGLVRILEDALPRKEAQARPAFQQGLIALNDPRHARRVLAVCLAAGDLERLRGVLETVGISPV